MESEDHDVGFVPSLGEVSLHGGYVQQLEVSCKAEKFPTPSGMNRTHFLRFTADALAHALFTTGRAPGDTADHGWSSVFEWLHRVALMPACLRRRPDGRIARTDLARELDRSEKVALSYAVGQATTGIFATQLLDVRFLMHVDRYGGSYQLVVPPKTKSRPDLFGQRRNGGWVVAEAKGRSTPIDTDLKNRMRLQNRMIRSVAGVPPEIAYGCCAYFAKATNGEEWLRMYAVDPLENEPEAIDFRVSSPTASSPPTTHPSSPPSRRVSRSVTPSPTTSQPRSGPLGFGCPYFDPLPSGYGRLKAAGCPGCGAKCSTCYRAQPNGRSLQAASPTERAWPRSGKTHSRRATGAESTSAGDARSAGSAAGTGTPVRRAWCRAGHGCIRDPQEGP